MAEEKIIQHLETNPHKSSSTYLGATSEEVISTSSSSSNTHFKGNFLKGIVSKCCIIFSSAIL